MRAIEKPPRSMHYAVFDSAIGTCGVAWSDAGVTRFQLPEASPEATEKRLQGGPDGPSRQAPPPAVAHAIADLQRYFAGKKVDFTVVEVDLEGVPPFYVRVYEIARQIGWGETATYGELAARVGSPGAARGVGQALSRNPVAVIIPCHRILASGNKVGGFSAFGGSVSKERLLALEDVRLGVPKDCRQLSFSEGW
ncbi:MAG: methylated-DNA--[protein]-cysteine S-methyltransferase [Hyphomicrobiaceae bacterium]|jgi:methylated-DNA-[protein]-cysteine S-methyltransferase